MITFTGKKMTCRSLIINIIHLYRKLKAWKDEISLGETDVWRYITNPLNAFLMIKRATADVKLIEKRFRIDSDEFLRTIQIFQPEDVDLLGAVEGLLRLQFFYKLKTKDFANGIIDGELTRRSPLSAHDLFVIGEEALKIEGQQYFALEYFKLVWEQLKNGLDADEEVDEETLILYMILSYKKIGNSGRALEMLDEMNTKFPETAKDPYYLLLENSLIDEGFKFGASNPAVDDPFSNYFVRDGIFSDSKDRILNGQICRGDVLKSTKETSKLRCRYVSTNPFSKLARFKIEEANLDPYVVLFIDVVSDDEIKFLKEASKPKQGPGTTTMSNLQQRVSSRR